MGVANNTGGSTGAHLHVNINIAPRGELLGKLDI